MAALADDGLRGPGAVTPLRPLTETAHNLPAALTSFVGRRKEREHLGRLLDDSRLVTLLGAGGCGKTRLALEIARDRLDGHPAGVWFVDLAAVTDPSAVPAAVADGLEITETSHRSLVDAIVDTIGSRPVLLVVDNCEHLVDACARLVDSLLARCACLAVVATSRQALGCSGEVLFRVPSLDVPAEGDDFDTIACTDAVALFVARAQRSSPRFALDSTNAATVGDISRRLDGIPLAIELAAARVPMLTVGQINDGLDDRLRLLTSGPRTALPRQQTLQASVDWSYDLLDESEQHVLQRLSVFANGFTLAAAEDVAVGDGIDRADILDLLTRLVDKSLIVTDHRGVPGRLGLLETVRQDAAARLERNGGTAAARHRHLDHFREFVRRRRDENEPEDEYVARMDLDYENVGRALQCAVDCTDGDTLFAMAWAAGDYWSAERQSADGARWCSLALDPKVPGDDRLRVAVLGVATGLQYRLGDWGPALETANAALALARQLGDQRLLMHALLDCAATTADLTGRDLGMEALEIADALGDDLGRARALSISGWLNARERGQVRAAGPMLTEALAISRLCGHTNLEMVTLGRLALLRVWGGQLATVLAPIEHAANLLRTTRRWSLLAECLGIAAGVYAFSGDDDTADEVLAELRDLSANLGAGAYFFRMIGSVCVSYGRADWAALELEVTPMLGLLSGNLGRMARGWRATARASLGDLDGAASDVAEAGTSPDDPVGSSTVTVAAALVARAKGDLAAAEDILVDALAAVDLETVIAPIPVVLLLQASDVSLRRGRADEAVRLAGHADAHARRLGMSTDTRLYKAFLGSTHDDCRAALGDERFDELWAEGASVVWEEAIAYLQRGRGQRKRPASGWDSLTPTEEQVVQLVVEGATNKDIATRLFMSVPTVKSHLTHVYAKLGMTNRAQLSAAAARRE